ncbi:hypothetical protein K490DRAFT_56588 [Saccharata proteae CBS 121410]|uniref:Uncharacterized protein n=1 Tax=Saccharata proteae CBS 121410 TaxID=1314787 RepID=A0A9P4HXT3_9PEZI|nr:hypothetical protein K490DRAFT_56588 [Saccharata proteae CBS 121410]
MAAACASFGSCSGLLSQVSIDSTRCPAFYDTLIREVGWKMWLESGSDDGCKLQEKVDFLQSGIRAIARAEVNAHFKPPKDIFGATKTSRWANLMDAIPNLAMTREIRDHVRALTEANQYGIREVDFEKLNKTIEKHQQRAEKCDTAWGKEQMSHAEDCL